MTKDQVRSTEEALDLSLEALEESLYATTAKSQFLAFEAITAIKQARSAPVQEPVAWMHVMDNTEGLKANGKGIVSITQKRKHPFGKPGVDFSKSYPVTSTPLYTTPPAQQARELVGLDEDEVEDCARGCANHTELARAIESKLREKNT
jgi:hypothetical protein